MSQEAKVVTKETEWIEADFYLLKLRLDRIDKIGFLYYLIHPKQAWRDFWLWYRFRSLVKTIKKNRVREKKAQERWRKDLNIKDWLTERPDIDKLLKEIEEKFQKRDLDKAEENKEEKPVDEKDKKE